MSQSLFEPYRPERRQSVRRLLDETDEALRYGGAPGATIWPCGFDLLDITLNGGFRSGELVLLGGSEGVGKTTFALQMLRNTVMTGRTALVFSFEHEPQDLVQRLLGLEAAFAAEASDQSGSAAADVNAFRAIFEASDPHRLGLAAALGRLSYGQAALTMVDGYAERLHLHESTRESTVEEIRKVVEEVILEVGEPPIVLIDYLQKVPGPEADEGARVTGVTESLKDLALEMRCPVIAVSAADQSSLAPGQRIRPRNLRGSSALAYEADVVVILASKESVVSRDHLVFDVNASALFRRWTVVSVEKNRHGGATGELELEKDFEHGRFLPALHRVSERLVDERLHTT